ncbi:hypothetical protein GX51_06401 [Blastomyces parvus]|uniref:Killer toxin Kp4 domain-containing protein n=1 Tax=Blastomyces parvus TaxID=2060905 RepID=A0A2B7WRT4_9EURO|nr:hypothetical protein GX51_06401 [Blastomyces parvus]
MKLTPLLTTTALTLLATTTTTTTATPGINCRGANECNSPGCQLVDLADKIARLPASQIFKAGEMIACCSPGTGDGAGRGRGRLCAFTQRASMLNSPGEVTALQARDYARALYVFGCRRCGSVAFDGWDGFWGELKVDYRD